MAAQTSTPIIPAPARLRPAAGEFRLVPGAAIACRDPILAPLARRFAQDAARRCGSRWSRPRASGRPRS